MTIHLCWKSFASTTRISGLGTDCGLISTRYNVGTHILGNNPAEWLARESRQTRLVAIVRNHNALSQVYRSGKRDSWQFSEFRAARQLAMPPAITVEMAESFSLYLVKAVLNGRTDEVIDLARTNLWR